MIIAVDFDGTCVEHSYPEMGKNIGAELVLRDLVRNGHQLILYTMRSAGTLTAAVLWFEHHKIPLWGINSNPEQYKWTKSPKIYAELYIDDAALGCPLIRQKNKRPYVDWIAVRKILWERNIL